MTDSRPASIAEFARILPNATDAQLADAYNALVVAGCGVVMRGDELRFTVLTNEAAIALRTVFTEAAAPTLDESPQADAEAVEPPAPPATPVRAAAFDLDGVAPIPVDILTPATDAVAEVDCDEHAQCFAAAALTAAIPAIEAHIRAKIAAELRNAADGRREYLANAPDQRSRELVGAGCTTLDLAADVVEGDMRPLYGWLPSWRWTPEMNAALDTRTAGEETDHA